MKRISCLYTESVSFLQGEKYGNSTEKIILHIGNTSVQCGASEQFRNIRQIIGTGRSRCECQHKIQSFAPGEVTPEQALHIGQELCKALFNDEYKYVLAVHVYHEHIHNHVIVNNVNFYTGKTFETEHNQGKIPERAWTKLRQVSDDLCGKYGLSITARGAFLIPVVSVLLRKIRIYFLIISNLLSPF